MRAPNILWSALFVIVVFLAEYFFGQETVATVGAAVAGVVSVALRMWQEWQTKQIVHTKNTRSVVAVDRADYWRRVLVG